MKFCSMRALYLIFIIVRKNQQFLCDSQLDKAKYFLRAFFYQKNNVIRHNLDIIYIEKNIFDNIFNTNMDMKGKKKETI